MFKADPLKSGDQLKQKDIHLTSSSSSVNHSALGVLLLRICYASAHAIAAPLLSSYGEREDYITRYTHPVDELVKQRWILEEDRAVLIHLGEQEWDEALK